MAYKGDPYKLIPDVQAMLRHWDPIGVFGFGGDQGAWRDEYDSYAPGVLSLLMSDGSVEELTAHLEGLRTGTMGLTAATERDREVAAQLIKWWEDISTSAA